MSGAPPSSRPSEGWTWARLRVPVLLFCLAACLRLAPVLAVPDLPIGLDDMFQYDMLGRSLAAGNGFRWYAPADQAQILAMLKAHTQVDVNAIALTDDPRGVETTFRAPLYPAFLAAIYRLSGLPGRLWAARLVQALVMALLAPMAFALALRLGASSRQARTAGVVVAVWPMLVVLPLALATENVFIPLVTFGILVVLRAAETRRDRDFALGGVIFGLAILTRSVIAGFPILAGIWLWRQGLRRGAILLAGAAMALTIPWSARNSLLNGQPTFVETSLGYNLYLGYFPGNDGTFQFGPSLDLATIQDDALRDQVGRERAWDFIRQDPGRVPYLMVAKLGHFWSLEERAFTYFYSNGLLGALPPWSVAALFVLLSAPLVLVLPPAIFGWVVMPKETGWWLVTWLLVWYIGIHVLVMAEERFHLALVPLVAALAARGVTVFPAWRIQLAAHARPARIAMAVAGALVALAVFNWGLELWHHAPQLAILFGPSGSQAHFNY